MFVWVPRKKKPPKRRKKREYTKIIITLVMVSYFAAVIFGGYIVFDSREFVGEWFALVGAPTATAIGYYCWKAKSENLAKIRIGVNKQEIEMRKELKEDYDTVKYDIEDKMYDYKEDIT